MNKLTISNRIVIKHLIMMFNLKIISIKAYKSKFNTKIKITKPKLLKILIVIQLKRTW